MTRLRDALDLLAWPLLTTVAAVIAGLDGGRLLAYLRDDHPDSSDDDVIA